MSMCADNLVAYMCRAARDQQGLVSIIVIRILLGSGPLIKPAAVFFRWFTRSAIRNRLNPGSIVFFLKVIREVEGVSKVRLPTSGPSLSH